MRVPRVRRPQVAAVLGVLAAGATAGACSSNPPGAQHRSATTSTRAVTVPPSTTTTGRPATTTTTLPPWPAVIVQAMAQFQPLPAGARAPRTLPAENGSITAQTGGLGGEDNVTLVVTPTPVPVNSPSLSSGGAGRELASFSTTPTASTSNASSQLASAHTQTFAACGGPSSPLTLPGGVAATTCPTFEGAAIDFAVGSWNVQVLTLSGTSPSTAEAGHVAGLFTPAALPASDHGGILSVVVPADASAGSADTAALEWTVGPAVYQVRSRDDPDAAIAVARAMRPYPA